MTKNNPYFLFRCSCGFETKSGRKMAQHVIESCTPDAMAFIVKALLKTFSKKRAITILGKALPMWAQGKLEDMRRLPRFNRACLGNDDDVYVC